MNGLFVAHAETLQMEADRGGWLTLRQPEPTLAKESPAELLLRTARLPSNFRYAAAPYGPVELLGEIPGDGEWVGPAADGVSRLLARMVEENGLPEQEEVEAHLDAAEFPWSRRETVWVVPVGSRITRELNITRVPGGVRVEAMLLAAEEIEPDRSEALTRFLTAVQGWLRWSRCECDARGVRVASFTAKTYLEEGLTHSLHSVATTCPLLVREVRALLSPTVAQAYLHFHGGS
jgi:hypothetical protein